MTTVARPEDAYGNRPCALPDTPLAAASAGLDACVHCGFCLQACPTYVNLEDENDSPRGRLVLMRRMLDGELAVDDADAGKHIDRCLGCRACETACPSGVPYGELLEATRATMAPKRGIPFVARVVLGVFARRGTLRVALLAARAARATGLPKLLARILPSRLAFPFAMLASTSSVLRMPRC
jgi:glycolate oxidase iron-sulfur subunit